MNYNNKLGVFENQITIGNPRIEGTVSYNKELQTYTFTGENIHHLTKTTPLQYLYKSIQGDFILRAHVRFVEIGSSSPIKIGWMVRNSLSDHSPHVNGCIQCDGSTSLQYSDEDVGTMEELTFTNHAPDVIQLERKQGIYFMSTAKFGITFTTIKIKEIHLKNEVFVGLYVYSKNSQLNGKIVFNNVRIIKPAAEDFTPYQDYIGSHMEIMDIETGDRNILFSSAHSLQAPNWVNRGKQLVYNSNGFLYRYSFETKYINQINTGFAKLNNNDHVFSFDEKMLGISHHNPDDDGNSSIYIMNPEGDSLPRKITKDGVGASYLHGISPDNKKLIYTAYRNEKYDIFGIDIETREEFQLTDTKYLDDGSEFSPDGNYIYFNSNRTGNMQIWRMKSDGSNAEQLTFDTNYKDWFPHISPNGKWIVFLSFPPTIGFGDHPFYKQCTIRLMSAKGGEPKIIAYIYGGQGSINVPSWNENSKQIAFVTNSD